MMTTSAPVRAFLRPSSAGRYPEIFWHCSVPALSDDLEASYGRGGYVGQICGHAWGIDDIVEIKLIDVGRGLAQEREWLEHRH
jgi:hypothetical protein